jgi:hypothetical protein
MYPMPSFFSLEFLVGGFDWWFGPEFWTGGLDWTFGPELWTPASGQINLLIWGANFGPTLASLRLLGINTKALG